MAYLMQAYCNPFFSPPLYSEASLCECGVDSNGTKVARNVVSSFPMQL